MLTHSRKIILCLMLPVLFLLSATVARGLPQANPAAPYLTYSVLLPPPTPTGLETLQFTLFGFTFTPGTLPPVGSAEYNYYTLSSFGETSFESADGGITQGGFGTDNSWVYSPDYHMASRLINLIPEDPLPPSDPFHFVVGASVPNGNHLYDQTFTLYNAAGPVATVVPCADGTGPCVGSHYIPYAAPSVPEASSVTLLGLGLAVGLIITLLSARLNLNLIERAYVSASPERRTRRPSNRKRPVANRATARG